MPDAPPTQPLLTFARASTTPREHDPARARPRASTAPGAHPSGPDLIPDRRGASDRAWTGNARSMEVVVAHSQARRRERLARVLGAAGHEVRPAATADEVLAACSGRTHVAVVD